MTIFCSFFDLELRLRTPMLCLMLPPALPSFPILRNAFHPLPSFPILGLLLVQCFAPSLDDFHNPNDAAMCPTPNTLRYAPTGNNASNVIRPN